MILRDEEGYPVLETHDPEEMLREIEGRREAGETIHWDDNETLTLDLIREQAKVQAEDREAKKIEDKRLADEEEAQWERDREAERAGKAKPAKS